MIELGDVQGLVVSGYAAMHEARYLLLEVTDPAAARGWIAGAADRVTRSDGPATDGCLNVAFTAAGLRAIGLGDDDLRSFPPPFVEGMTAPHRQRILGDTGPSDPTTWGWGWSREVAGQDEEDQEPLHAVVLLYAPDGAAIDALEQAEVALLTAGGAFRVLHRLVPEPLPGRLSVGKFGVEHFGFADGMSQPVIEGTGRDDALSPAERRRSLVAAGEFVLGYPNGYDQVAPVPTFGHNGTYLVVRQLAQDVAGFWGFLDGCTRTPGQDRAVEAMDRLAATMVGRWKSGAPLVASPHRDDPDLALHNDFGYAEVDPDGLRCPLGAHIRRANPRDRLVDDPVKSTALVNLHRIVRRGRVYGAAPADDFTPDGVDRGLFFMCINANIERQFEFVQHSWLNNEKFGGPNDERDPLVGNPEGGGSFTRQEVPFRRRDDGLPNFVSVVGGAYFFLPGIAALRRLGAPTLS